MSTNARKNFTTDDDTLLCKFLAVYQPNGRRMGNVIYQKLVDNEEGKWPWSSNHTWHSWRERYKKHQTEFDAKIKRYQLKHGIHTDGQENTKDELQKRVEKVRRAAEQRKKEGEPARVNGNGKRGRHSAGGADEVKRARVEEGVAREKANGVESSRNLAGPRDEAEKQVSPGAEIVGSPDKPIRANDYSGELFEDDSVSDVDAQPRPAVSNRAIPTYPSLTDAPNPSLETAPPTKIPKTYPSNSPSKEHALPSTYTQEPTPPGTTPPSPPTPRSFEELFLNQPPPKRTASRPFPPLPRDTVSIEPSPSERGRPSRGRPQPVLKRRLPADNEDPFSSSPAPATPAPAAEASPSHITSRPARQPPRLDNGPFVSAFARADGTSRLSRSGRRSSGVDVDEEKDQWPPLGSARERGFVTPLPKSKSSSATSVLPAHLDENASPYVHYDEDGDVTPVPDIEAPLVSKKDKDPSHSEVKKDTPGNTSAEMMPPPAAIPGPSKKRFVMTQANAVASSSRVKLPDKPKPNSASIFPPPPAHAPRPSNGVTSSFKTQVPAVVHPAPAYEIDTPSTAAIKPAVIPEPKTKDEVAFRIPPVARGTSDPFLDHADSPPPPKAQIEARAPRRQTFAGFDEYQTRGVPFVDLRASKHLSFPRYSLPAWSSIPLSPLSGSISHPPITVNENAIIHDIGIREAIRRMAQNQGFQEGVVWRVWEATRSLERADAMLCKMRVVAQRALDEGIGMGEVEVDGGEERQGEKEKERARVKLMFTPAGREEEEEEEYEPPDATRAKEYRRLVQQGREGEARRREAKRAGRSSKSFGGEEGESPVKRFWGDKGQEFEVEEDDGDREVAGEEADEADEEAMVEENEDEEADALEVETAVDPASEGPGQYAMDEDEDEDEQFLGDDEQSMDEEGELMDEDEDGPFDEHEDEEIDHKGAVTQGRSKDKDKGRVVRYSRSPPVYSESVVSETQSCWKYTQDSSQRSYRPSPEIPPMEAHPASSPTPTPSSPASHASSPADRTPTPSLTPHTPLPLTHTTQIKAESPAWSLAEPLPPLPNVLTQDDIDAIMQHGTDAQLKQLEDRMGSMEMKMASVDWLCKMWEMNVGPVAKLYEKRRRE